MKRRIKTPEVVLGSLLRDIRKDVSMTQEEVAKRMGLPGGTIITRIETGQRPMRISEFISFCQAVEQDPAEVLAEHMRDLRDFADEIVTGR
jgi:transcriptional regulator with XRE-family HTH domain